MNLKTMMKKNQIMITALAIMIAVAGYLNFAGTKISDEEIVETGAVVSETAGTENAAEDQDVTALFEISDEDMEQAEDMDIASMDSEMDMEEADFNPGEAVFTSSTGVDTLSGAKLVKEQVRAKNKETFLEIINNANISEEQKQDAVDGMIKLTDLAEKETSAEILLEAKGFDDAVVSIADGMADVVINAVELSEAQRAQIEDIVVRKTGIAPENIIISMTSEE